MWKAQRETHEFLWISRGGCNPHGCRRGLSGGGDAGFEISSDESKPVRKRMKAIPGRAKPQRKEKVAPDISQERVNGYKVAGVKNYSIIET